MDKPTPEIESPPDADLNPLLFAAYVLEDAAWNLADLPQDYRDDMHKTARRLREMAAEQDAKPAPREPQER